MQLRTHPWGTAVDLRAHGFVPTRATQIYEVWFVSSGGRVSARAFTVGPRGRVAISLAAALRARYSSLGVTLEPDGLNAARRGPNILRPSGRSRKSGWIWWLARAQIRPSVFSRPRPGNHSVAPAGARRRDEIGLVDDPSGHLDQLDVSVPSGALDAFEGVGLGYPECFDQ